MSVSICVIGGAGLIGRRHVAHCLEEPTVVLSSVVEPTEAGAAWAREQGIACYSGIAELLEAKRAGKVQVDGVILATPNASHVPLATLLLEAGIPTLVEKPLSTDVLSGRALVQVEKQSTARILVGQHRRFNPYVVNAKRLITSGALGQVLAVQGQWAALKPLQYFEPPADWRRNLATGGGVVLINLVHDIDLFRYLFGNITRVYCEMGHKTRGFDVEETGAITLRFASGTVGTFVFSDAAASPASFESATGENPLVPQLGQPIYNVLGTKGSFSFPELKLFRYTDDSQAWFDRLVIDPASPIDPTPPFTHQLRHFVQVIRNELEPNCSAQDALLTILTLESILESAKTGLPVEIAES
ncbi:transcription regulator GAL80 [Sporobolomyces koalae]|uniref:transcription regulator GAL80 n=1 Tax=Sporobolomyces koalae TaxID=500713 RepID=UPI00317A0034